MTLVDRLSAFFLGAIAVVLVATSAGVYAVARVYLHHQLDDRLEAALDTLEAAVDVEPGGLEWEPHERRITLGTDPGPDQVRWAVIALDGEPIDLSANAPAEGFPPAGSPDVAPSDSPGDATTTADLPGWRLAGRRLRLEELLRAGRGHPDDDSADDDIEYAGLILAVGLSPEPARLALSRLAIALVVVSGATWGACAIVGRRLVRRALSPLTRMAEAARRIDPDDPGWALPEPGSRDELGDLASAYNALLSRLRHAFDAQRSFAGEASHQLRTPLAGLLGQIDVALRRDRPAEEYRRVLLVAREEASRLRKITESLLLLARPASLAPGRVAIDLGRWLPERAARWASHPRSADLRVEPFPETPVVVLGHPELLGQVVDNLIENALKFSPAGTPVTLSALVEGDRAGLAVADLGPGLGPGDLTMIFEPFRRADSARHEGKPGVGLGLAVARRIAESLGGSIDARSAPGSGTLFRLLLPRADRAGVAIDPGNPA